MRRFEAGVKESGKATYTAEVPEVADGDRAPIDRFDIVDTVADRPEIAVVANQAVKRLPPPRTKSEERVES